MLAQLDRDALDDSSEDHVEAEHHEGITLVKKGRLAEALGPLRRAARRRPDAAEIHHNLGVALAMQGKLAEAEASLREALRLQPDSPDTFSNLGLALVQQKRPLEAIECYREFIRLRPDSPDILHRLGNLLRSEGQVEEAVEHYRRAIPFRPDWPELHHSLGLALADLDRWGDAVASYGEALRLRPDFADAHNNLGLALQNQGKTDEAIACFREALRLRPGQPETHNNLGIALATQGRLEDAVASYESALERQPTSAAAHNNLGNALRRQGKIAEALSHLEEALRIKPDYADAYNNRGVALMQLGDPAQAIDAYTTALNLKPDYADAGLNRALALLLQGDYARGYAEYEWRWRRKDRKPPDLGRPRWDGSNLDGRTILLWAEQGLGDTIQFARYAEPVRRRGGRVVLQAPGPLATLLKGCPGVERVVGEPPPSGAFDVQAPLMSLPLLCGTGADAVTAPVPYIAADPERIARWRHRLRPDGRLIVGLAWRGNPKYAGDKERSAPLSAFGALAGLSGVRLVSLQKGGADEIRQAGLPVEDLGTDDWPDFAETAAFVQAIDLVVSVDTAVAHLAGALGVPVWIALPFAPDWRWGRERTDTPWYPTARLFRQRLRGDWAEVVGRMAEELPGLARSGVKKLVADGRAEADALQNEGVALVEKGRLAEAIERFRRAMQADPHHIQARNNLGVALARAGRLDEAIAEFREVARREPESPEAHGNLGLAYLHKGSLDDAVASFQEALLRKPDDPEVHNNLGVALCRQRKFSAAEAEHRAAARHRPSHAETHSNLANALLLQGRRREAIAEAEEALRLKPNLGPARNTLETARRQLAEREEAAARYQKSLDSNPSDTPTRLLLSAELNAMERWDDALAQLDEVVRRDGGDLDVEVVTRRGGLLRRIGRSADALLSLQELAERRPDSAEAQYNLAGQLVGEGDLERAEVHYRRAIAIRADYPEAHNGLGILLKTLGRDAEAVESYRRALEHRPESSEIHSNLGVALGALGRLDEAVAAHREAIRLNPQSAEAHNNLGSALRKLGKLGEAVENLLAARRLKPDYVGAYSNLGAAFADLGRTDEAIAHLRRALEIRPDYIDALNNLGVVLTNAGRAAEAIEVLRRARGVNPESAECRCNLGNALLGSGEPVEALAELDESLRLKADYADAHNNRGVALMQLGDPAGAVACYDRALELKPDYPDAGLNRALALLLQGDYEHGWAEYEWRWRRKGRGAPDLGRPRWDGSKLDGRTILLWAEQGLGDTIHFARYAELVRRRGGKVVLQAAAPLVPLLRGCPGVDRVVTRVPAPDEFDVQAPLMSLPSLFGTTVDSIPGVVPYLSADPRRAARWRERLRTDGRLVVGLAWRGNPKFPGDRERSMLLDDWAPLLGGRSDLRVVSLQKGAKDEIRGCGLPVEDLGADDWPDFAETAAVIAAVDLVIAVDTAVAHLAGALGVATWVALPFAPDWRWGRERGDSPWYPTARLFRQSRRGDWSGVVREMTQAVAERPDSMAPPPSEEAAEPFFRQGSRLLDAGELADAEASLLQAVRLKPGSASFQMHLGVAMARQGQLLQAIERFEEVVRIEPGSAAAQGNLGLALLQSNQFDRARASLEAAILLDPNSAETHNNLGIAMAHLGRTAEAEEAYRRALALDPDYAGAFTNLGNLHRSEGRFEDALACYRQALRLRPDEPETYNNQGIALGGMCRGDQAIAQFEKAIALAPEHAEARFNRALAFLLQGDYARGWPEYEWRWRRKDRKPLNPPRPRWDGSSLEGRTIFLWSEQGLGDMIQFARYAALLAQWGAKVILQAPAPLVKLLGTCPGIDRLVTEPPPASDYDVHAPVMSLAGLCGTRVETIPAPIPYLTADPGRAAAWRERLRTDDRLVVGVVWRGNPKYGGDRERSTTLAELAPLAGVSGVRLVSLQKGAAGELPGADLAVEDIGVDGWADLAETAAVVAALDLVIAVDTAVAHLAGALGVPVWIALPFAPDWRWGLGRDDSAWYPTARLFRQRSRGDWRGVFGEMAEAIAARPARADRADSIPMHDSGMQALSEGRTEDALRDLRRAIEMDPENVLTYNNLGVVLAKCDRLAEAAGAFREVLRRRPESPEAWGNLGLVYLHRGRAAEALVYLHRALELDPDSPSTHNNQGVARLQINRPDAAFLSYEKALALRPHYNEVRSNRARAWLVKGDYARGWAEYEWRWKTGQLTFRQSDRPLWDGSPLDGRTILLWAEQGLGDTLQFIRYAALVKERGGRVIVECPRRLIPLLRGCPGIDELYSGEVPEPFDVHAPMLSLPYLLGTRLETVPARVPYLAADADRLESWREELDRETTFRVAIAWHGNPKNDPPGLRDIPLRHFAALAELEGVQLFSVQKGEGRAEIAEVGDDVPLVDLADRLDTGDGAFLDTAAVLSSVDLVITSDTSIAHLAGALGVPLWIGLHVGAEWRWLRDRDDTPWYPTARLFRQPHPGDWGAVMARMAEELKELVARPDPRRQGVGASAEALHRRGLDAISQGRLGEAAKLLRRAVRLAPAFHQARNNLGVVLARTGKLDEAVACFEVVNRHDADGPGASGNLGLAHMDQGKLAEAEADFRRALRFHPEGAELNNNLGIVLSRLERFEEAVPHYEAAIRSAPEYAEAYHNLSNSLRALGRLDEAIEALQVALKLRPGFTESLNSLGLAFARRGNLERAEACYRQVLRLKPEQPETLNNLGIALADQGQLDEAIRCYDEVLRQQPESECVRRNRALALLRLGDYARGWPEYEWRWRGKDRRLPDFGRPAWDGAPLDGRPILLWSEQGLGDTIQFARYAGLVRDRGGRVILQAQGPLVELMKTCEGVGRVVEVAPPAAQFEAHASLMTLPMLFGTTIDDIPAPIPYLSAEPARAAYWRDRLRSGGGPVVGVVWRGNPKYAGDHHRSAVPEQLAPLSEVAGIRLVSLQKGAGDRLPAGVEDIGAEGWANFAETAAVIGALDLVVSVDTAVAHLAGALGVPTWMAVSYASDWRWQRDREDTPWYPSMRLFRQRKRGDWPDVFERMAAAIPEFAGRPIVAGP